MKDVIIIYLEVKEADHRWSMVNGNISNHWKVNVEAGSRTILWKKVFLDILQNSQENTCARVSILT